MYKYLAITSILFAVSISIAFVDSTLYSFVIGHELFEMNKVTLKKGELEQSITNYLT